MNFHRLNLLFFVAADFSILALRAIIAVFFFTCSISITQAAITWSGEVNPIAPTNWISGTTGYIGDASTGTVTVDGGSALLSQDAHLGHNSGSSGTATVTGAGSNWNNWNYLYVGDSGSGTLNIEAGGQVIDSVCQLGFNSGSSGTVTVTGAGSNWTNYQLFVGVSGCGTLNIEAGGRVSDDSESSLSFVGYKPGSTGRVTVTGADSKWTNNGYIYVGYFGIGTLSVTDGGTVTTNRGLFASLDNLSGNGTITTNGAVLDADLVFDATHGLQQTLRFGTDGTLNLNQKADNALGAGYQGHGTLRIADGKSVASSEGYIGYHTGSTGVATVTGTSSKWTTNGNMYVGNYGSGTLNVTDGGAVTVIGGLFASLNNLSGNGSITAYGAVMDADLVFDAAHGLVNTFSFGTGGTLNINQNGGQVLGAGFKGNGTLRIADGKKVTSFDGYVGYHSSSTGNATVTGTGTKWTNPLYLYVGYYGKGTLNIEAGGLVSVNFGSYLGYDTGSIGTATVTGSGSKWTNGTSNLIIGNLGSGTLNIKMGGQVSNSACYVGFQSGSSGTATVTGTNSIWTNSGDLHVGLYSNGTLNIEAGGQVSNYNGYLGDQTGSSGTATVTGPGSIWDNAGTLYVGNYGSGILNIGSGIGSGGLVKAYSLYVEGRYPQQGICNINGGSLQVGLIAGGGGIANWNDGVIRNYDANSNLTVYSLALKLAATGSHAFQIDAGRTGTVYSVLRDATSGGTLTKLGPGLLTLTATNTYTGDTIISAGTLALSSTGTLASSGIDVAGGAIFDVSAKSGGFTLGTGRTLKGSGTIVGDLSINGTHAPGSSLGIETVQGNYSLRGQLAIELMGTAAGIGYDQMLLPFNGSTKYNITLSGTLLLDWNEMNGSTDTTKLWILKNDTAGTLSGTFSNYPSGAWLGNHNDRDWFIRYGANAETGNLTGGNDVVIAAVPEPATIMLLASAVLVIGICRRRFS